MKILDLLKTKLHFMIEFGWYHGEPGKLFGLDILMYNDLEVPTLYILYVQIIKYVISINFEIG